MSSSSAVRGRRATMPASKKGPKKTRNRPMAAADRPACSSSSTVESSSSSPATAAGAPPASGGPSDGARATGAAPASPPASKPASAQADGRCTTTSGAYRCDSPTGHAGPCETVQPSTPWVGPAERRRPALSRIDRDAADRMARHGLASYGEEASRRTSTSATPSADRTQRTVSSGPEGPSVAGGSR
jgi:hypothetical protein